MCLFMCVLMGETGLASTLETSITAASTSMEDVTMKGLTTLQVGLMLRHAVGENLSKALFHMIRLNLQFCLVIDCPQSEAEYPVPLNVTLVDSVSTTQSGSLTEGLIAVKGVLGLGSCISVIGGDWEFNGKGGYAIVSLSKVSIVGGSTLSISGVILRLTTNGISNLNCLVNVLSNELTIANGSSLVVNGVSATISVSFTHFTVLHSVVEMLL